MDWTHEIEQLKKVGGALKAGVSLASKLPGAFYRSVTGQDQFTKQVRDEYHASRGKIKTK